MPTLKINGDWIEHRNAGWLAVNLSHYEPIWAEFIGNSGDNSPNPSRPVRPEFAKNYALFVQRHYTLAVALIRMREVVDRIEQRALERIGISATPAHYLDDVDQYFLFMAYLGNAVDQLLRMDELLAANLGTQAKLQSFYDYRHTVVHGPRIPLKTDDFQVHVPRLAGTNARPGDWYPTLVWGSVPDENFIPLTTYCCDVLASFLGPANVLLGSIRGALPKWFFPKEATLPAQSPEPQAPHQKPSDKEESWEGRGLSGQALLPRHPFDEPRD